MANKRTHARYSPSSLTAKSKCRCFDYNDSDETSALEGTELHAAAETGDLRGLSQEQAKDVRNCLDYVKSLTAGDGPANWIDLSEARLELEGLTYGHADKVLIHMTKPEAHVADYKFVRTGGGDYTQQIEAYAAALYEMLLKGLPIKDADGNVLYQFDGPRDISKITTHLIAPRLGDIETQEYDGAELLRSVRSSIEKLYVELDDPFKKPTPHADLCGKCRHAAKCPAIGAVAVLVAKGIGLPIPSTFAPDSMIDPVTRMQAQVVAGALTSWIEEIKKNNAAFVEQGGEIPLYKMTTRSTGLRINADMTPLALLKLEEAGFDRLDLLECCSLALGKLTDRLSEATGNVKAEIKEQMREVLGDLLSEGSCSYLAKVKRLPDAAMLGEGS